MSPAYRARGSRLADDDTKTCRILERLSARLIARMRSESLPFARLMRSPSKAAANETRSSEISFDKLSHLWRLLTSGRADDGVALAVRLRGGPTAGGFRSTVATSRPSHRTWWDLSVRTLRTHFIIMAHKSGGVAFFPRRLTRRSVATGAIESA